MKKLLSAILAVMMCITMLSPAGALATTDSVYTIGSVEGEVGETVDVPVSYKTTTAARLATIVLQYDAAKLEFVGFTWDAALNGMRDTTLSNANIANKSILTAFTADQLYDGIIGTIQFKILDGATGDIAVSANAVTKTAANEKVTSSVVAGNVTVKASTPPAHTCGNLTEVKGTAATCTTAGTATYFECSCGKKYTDVNATAEITNLVIPALGHSGEYHEEVPATAGVAGTKAHFACAVCGKNFESSAADAAEITDLVIPALPETTTDSVYTIGSVEGEVGETVDVPVSYKTTTAARLATIVLQYDAAKLEFVGFTWDAALNGMRDTTLSNANIANKSILTAFTADQLYDGIIGTIQFKILDGATGDIAVSANAVTKTAANEKVTSSVVAGNVTVKASTPPAHTCGNLTEHKGTDATCTTAGTKTYYECSCGKKYTDVNATEEITDLAIPATGHSEEKDEIPGKEATCTEAGYTAGEKCQVCGTTTKENEDIPAKGHTGTAVEAKAATCTETGNVAYFACTVCNGNYESKAADAKKIDDVEIPAKGHTGAAVEAKAPTCTEAGNVAHFACTACGKNFESKAADAEEIKEITIAALGHDKKAQVPEFIPDDCSKDGMKAHYYCEVCKAYFSDADYKVEVKEADLVIPADHKYGDLVPAKDKTCTEDGMKAHYQCSSCKKYFDEAKKEVKEDELVIPASHELTLVPAKDKTCTEDGNVAYYDCADCDVDFEDAEATKVIETVVVPAGHEIEKVDAKAETCTEDGNKAYKKCTVCDTYFDAETDEEIADKASVVIPATGHSEEKDVISGTAATCTTRGLTDGEKCKTCKVWTTKQTVIPATGHSLVKTEEKAATCTEVGYAAYWTCEREDCKRMFADEAATEEIYSKADVLLETLAHVMGEWEVTNEPTDSKDGDKKRVCLNDGCEYEELAKIPMTGTTCDHAEWETSGIDEIIKEATCTEAGLKNILCIECYEVAKENVEIPALGHMDGEYSTIYYIGEKPATCTEAGHKEHYACGMCEALFSDADGKTPIEAPEEIAALGHTWGAEEGGVKTCSACGAIQFVPAEEGAESAEVKVEEVAQEAVLTENEQVALEINPSASVTIATPIVPVANPVTELVDEIETLLGDVIENIKAFVVDITVEKTITGTGDYDVTDEKVSVTNLPIEIEILIPGEIRGMDNYRVIRHHEGEGVKEITTTEVDGEKIVVDKENHKIKLYVKKFSEYAIVGEDVTTPAPSTGGSRGGSSYSVKFVTNADVKLASVSVKKNATLSEPVAITKDGFVFDGWYTDASFTEKYDFTKAVTKSFTLYAKWVEVEGSGDGWNVFADVKESHWFYEAVKYVNLNGLMNGVSDSKFAPNNTLTRAMLVTVLYRNAGEPATNKSIPFADVDMGSWYANAVVWAKQNGIVNGVTENNFAPDANITREQIATIMFRYAQYKGMETVTLEENLHFTDANEISEYAVSAMNWAVGTGLINGKSAATLNPLDNATRAEIAAILQRFMETNK